MAQLSAARTGSKPTQAAAQQQKWRQAASSGAAGSRTQRTAADTAALASAPADHKGDGLAHAGANPHQRCARNLRCRAETGLLGGVQYRAVQLLPVQEGCTAHDCTPHFRQQAGSELRSSTGRATRFNRLSTDLCPSSAPFQTRPQPPWPSPSPGPSAPRLRCTHPAGQQVVGASLREAGKPMGSTCKAEAAAAGGGGGSGSR